MPLKKNPEAEGARTLLFAEQQGKALAKEVHEKNLYSAFQSKATTESDRNYAPKLVERDQLEKKLDELSIEEANIVPQRQALWESYEAGYISQKEYDEGTSTSFDRENQIKQEMDSITIDIGLLNTKLKVADSALVKAKDDIETAEKGLKNLDEAPIHILSAEEATNRALFEYEEQMQQLASSYTAAYESGLTNINSQFGFNDHVGTVSLKEDESAKDIISELKTNMDSQKAYTDQYAQNLEKIYNYDLGKNEAGEAELFSAELLSRISDEGQDGAKLAEAIGKLIDAGETETLKELNSSFEGVETAKENFATTKGIVDSDMESKLEEIQTAANDFIGALKADDNTLKDIAQANVNEYFNQMRLQLEPVKAAAGDATQAVADGINEKLEVSRASGVDLANAIINGFRGGYLPLPEEKEAIGTTNASNLFLAGEEGPELVVGAGGSRVFTAGATKDILSRAVNDSFLLDPGSTTTFTPLRMDNEPSHTQHTVKDVNVSLNGMGVLSLSRSASKENMLEVLAEHIEPILINILERELFEEPDGSYFF